MPLAAVILPRGMKKRGEVFLCIGVPGKVVEILGQPGWAVVETSGIRRNIGMHFIEGVRPGDYVMVHAGYAIEIIDPGEARERIRILEELLFNESL